MSGYLKNLLGRGPAAVHLLMFACALPILLAASSLPASGAQSITAHSTVNLTADASDYDAGEKVSSNNTISWTSDVDWLVTVKSLNANLGQSDDLSYTKALADLNWRLSSGGTWTPVTTSDVTVTSGVTGTGSGSFDVDYKFLLAWDTDKPGAYGTTLQFTITAQ